MNFKGIKIQIAYFSGTREHAYNVEEMGESHIQGHLINGLCQ